MHAEFPDVARPGSFKEHHGAGFAGPPVLPPVRGKAQRHEVREAWGRVTCR